MNNVIIYTNTEGRAAIVIPAHDCGLSVEEIAEKDVPTGTEYHIIDRSDIPSEVDFRNAWEISSGSITVNFLKAVEITKDRLRHEREPLFHALDVQFQRNLETQADNTAVVTAKQRLRDLPALADGCTTLDELRALTANLE